MVSRSSNGELIDDDMETAILHESSHNINSKQDHKGTDFYWHSWGMVDDILIWFDLIWWIDWLIDEYINNNKIEEALKIIDNTGKLCQENSNQF